MRAYIGRLRYLTAPPEYQFWAADGTIIEGITDCEQVTLEEPIEVMLDGKRLVHWAPDLTQPKALRDTTRKDIALVRVIDEPSREEQAWPAVIEHAKELQDWIRWSSRGQWQVTVTPYVLADPEAGTTLQSGIGDIQDHVNAVNPDHTHNYWHGWGGGSPDWAGQAYQGSNQCWTHTGLQVMKHEQYHCFGLGHHTKNKVGEDYSGYSVMGAKGPSIAAPNQDNLGLVEAQKVARVNVGEAKRFFLLPPEIHPQAMAPGEHKLVYIDRGNEKYAVSMYNGVAMVDAAKGTFGQLWWPGSAMEGETWVSPEGLSVQLVGVNKQVAEVVVKYDQALSNPSPAAPPTILLPDESAETIDAGKSGIWGHREYSESHQGFNVHVKPNAETGKMHVTLYFFTHGRNGELRWFLMEGPIENGIAMLKVWSLVQSSYVVDLEPIGEAWLYFHDADHGVVKWDMDEKDSWIGARGSQQIRRLTTRVDDELNGVYEFEDKDWHGIAMSVNRAKTKDGVLRDDVMAGFRYGYHFKNARMVQTWHYLDGFKGEDLDVFLPVDGKPNVLTDSRLEPAGTAKFTRASFRWGDEVAKLERFI